MNRPSTLMVVLRVTAFYVIPGFILLAPYAVGSLVERVLL